MVKEDGNDTEPETAQDLKTPGNGNSADRAKPVSIDLIRTDGGWSREAFTRLVRGQPSNPKLAAIQRLREDLAHFSAAPLSRDYGDRALLRTPSQISLPPRFGRVLYSLIADVKPRLVVEAGAGYGISGCYIAAALAVRRCGMLVSFEPGRYGSIAGKHHALFHDRCYLFHKRFEAMPDILAGHAQVSAYFIDAAHDADTVARQLKLAAGHASPGALIVLDDACTGGSVNEGFRAFWKRADVQFCAIVGRRLGVILLNGPASPSVDENTTDQISSEQEVSVTDPVKY